MSTDGQPKKPQVGLPDWPGREQGVPPPPTPTEVEEVSGQQGLITDEWADAPEPDPSKPGSTTDR